MCQIYQGHEHIFEDPTEYYLPSVKSMSAIPLTESDS